MLNISVLRISKLNPERRRKVKLVGKSKQLYGMRMIKPYLIRQFVQTQWVEKSVFQIKLIIS